MGSNDPGNKDYTKFPNLNDQKKSNEKGLKKQTFYLNLALNGLGAAFGVPRGLSPGHGEEVLVDLLLREAEAELGHLLLLPLPLPLLSLPFSERSRRFRSLAVDVVVRIRAVASHLASGAPPERRQLEHEHGREVGRQGSGRLRIGRDHGSRSKKLGIFLFGR